MQLLNSHVTSGYHKILNISSIRFIIQLLKSMLIFYCQPYEEFTQIFRW